MKLKSACLGLCFAWALSAHTADLKIEVTTPGQGETLAPGEISFSWSRPAGDKTPLLLEIRSKTGKGVYQRSTIGTRRTKSLEAGEYEWKLSSIHAEVKMEWTAFKIEKNGNVKQMDPALSEPVTEVEIKVDETSVEIEKLNGEIVEQMKKNDQLAQQFEERLKNVQEARTGERETLQNMQAVLDEMNRERQRLEEKLLSKKAEMAIMDVDQEIILKAGPKPLLSSTSNQMLEAVSYLRARSKFPKSLKLVNWSVPETFTLEGQVHWAARVRIVGDNSQGGPAYRDVIVFWRLGELKTVRYASELF